jgi:diaminopimelate decarboxylase
MISECLGVNKAGHLTIGGMDTVEIAKKYGTPLYVMDEDLIRKYCRMYQDALDKYYNGNGLALYASKAFCCVAACRIAAEEGMGLDVVSGGEIYTALKAGFPMEHVYFHGNNKTEDELVLALDSGVGRIVVDNADELNTLSRLAGERNKTADIMFRIKPGIDAHTHDFVRTGQIDSKFGVALENGEAFEIVKAAIQTKNVRLVGVHCHIGSQIFELSPFELAAEVMLGFILKIKNELNYEIDELNLGGGFGIKYIESHNPVKYDSYIESVSRIVKSICADKGIKLPKILMEPGRSIAAPSGITLYTVGNIKTIKDVRTYMAVDGGMCDNPRYALYQSAYTIENACNANAPKDMVVTVAGKCCESGDLIGEHMNIQQTKVGDVVAVLATGAYNYSMASNYNRIPRPAVVMVKGESSRVVIKRESYEDLVQNDVL